MKQLPLITLAFALTTALPAVAQDPAAKVDELKALQESAAQSAEKQKALEEQIAAQAAEQDQLSRDLVAIATDMQAAEERASLAIEKQRGLQKEKADLGLELALQQDELSDILAGLQSLERDPPPALVAAPGDVLDALRGAMLFGTVVPELRDKAVALRDKLESLVEIDRQLVAEASAEREAVAVLTEKRGALKLLLTSKEQALKAAETDLATEQDRARAVAAKAQSLRELIMKLLAEREIAASAARKAEEERVATAKAEEERKRMLAALPMAGAKGKLRLPVSGVITRRFGDDTGLGHGLDGIVIEAATQALVTTPVSGRIEFAGPFRSYGSMVIVNAGDSYLVLVSGLGETQVQSGQQVLAGEPIGLVADLATSTAQAAAVAKDLTTGGKPVLYVEFRKNGDPVDPAPWWDNPRQEALR